MKINELIDCLQGDTEKIESTIDTTGVKDHIIQISGLKVKSSKELAINCEKTIEFYECEFGSISISKNSKVSFTNCKIKTLNVNAKAIITITNLLELNTFNIWGGSSIFLNHTKNINSISIVYHKIEDCNIIFNNLTIGTLEIWGKFKPGNKCEISHVKCDTLRFENADFTNNQNHLFHKLRVDVFLLFYDSKMSNICFNSCNFSKAFHIIAESSFQELDMINIKWFKRIYYARKYKASVPILKLSSSKNKLSLFFWKLVNRFVNFKVLLLGYLLKEDRSRIRYRLYHYEYVDAYRNYKSMMKKKNNRADEIYFRAKEFNAKLKYLSIIRDFNEKVIILFNKYTNNHGSSWKRSLFGVLSIGFVFFLLYNRYYFLPDKNNFILLRDYAQYLLFLIPTHDFNLLGKGISNISISLDWLHRILNTAMIYQFVIAFRKYKE